MDDVSGVECTIDSDNSGAVERPEAEIEGPDYFAWYIQSGTFGLLVIVINRSGSWKESRK